MLIAKRERIYTESGAHVATVWAEPIADARLEGESWIEMRNRTMEIRNANEQATLRRAELFAASADMLTALETVLAGGHLTTGEQAIVANAISKATGKSIDEVLRVGG